MKRTLDLYSYIENQPKMTKILKKNDETLSKDQSSTPELDEEHSHLQQSPCVSANTTATKEITIKPIISKLENTATESIAEPLPFSKKISKLNKAELNPDSFANPDDYARKIFESIVGYSLKTRPSLELSTVCPTKDNETPFFPPLSEENMNGYDIDAVTAIREQDLPTLRALKSSGRSMSCHNQYGESLLHTACRRGFTSVVSFLIEEADIPARISDDCGRTPFHDALWNRDCQFDIFKMLVMREPELLLVTDKRGATPFRYARREHWEDWKQWLWKNLDCLENAVDENILKLFQNNVN